MEHQLGLLDQAGVVWEHVSGLELRVRESNRAKRLTLQVAPPGLIEVVVPRGTRARDVQNFVGQNRAWIERAGASLEARPPEPVLPEVIELAAVPERICVRYEFGSTRRGRWREANGELAIWAPEPGDAVAAGILRQWLMERARAYLKPRLLSEAQRLGVRPAGVQIRLQRTRWGSCSSHGNISLNAALMLVEPGLVRYLLVHELSHLTHLNHSAQYWRRVARFEPGFRELDRRISGEWSALPQWIFCGRGA
jgi:predicted metal-dependent hydrolase